MKIALVQMSPRLGDVAANADRHLEFLEKARAEKADLVVFPELGLTGYNLKDLVPDVACDPERSPVFRKIIEASRGMSVVVGFVEERETQPGFFFNSAAFLAGGTVIAVHRKVFLPTFGMFEEGKFFAVGRDFRSFPAPAGRTGLLICRDFLQYGANYAHIADGADFIVVISAAPGRGVSGEAGFDSSRMWELMGETVSFFSSAFVLYCNRVGIEDGLSFAGGSFIFGPDGNRLARAADLDEEMLVCDVDPRLIRDVRRRQSFRRDDRPDVILRSLERTLRSHED